jgi:hypothetical protein
MRNQFTLLFYLSSVGGLVMIVGGIWIIYKQKIYIDRETKQVTEIEVPFLGKLKTNAPALVLFLLGFLGLFYPTHKSGTEYLTVKGNVSSQVHPVVVYAVVQSEGLEQDGSFNLPIPELTGGNYAPQVVYVAGGAPYVFEDLLETERQKNGVIELVKKEIGGSQQPSRFQPDIAPAPPEFKH